MVNQLSNQLLFKVTEKIFEKYISYNYNYIDSVLEAKGRYYIEKIMSVMSQFKYAHCVVEILSMGKRLMN